MAYDPLLRKVVLFGGVSFENDAGISYDDTWEWDSQKWTKVG